MKTYIKRSRVILPFIHCTCSINFRL